MTKEGTLFKGKRLIVCTGFTKEKIPQFPNVHLCETYANFNSDPQGFKNAKVLIIGTGNSGFEVATSLIDYTHDLHIMSPAPVRLATHTHYVGDVRNLNTKPIENYILKSSSVVIVGEIKNLEKVGSKYRATLYFKQALYEYH
mmetsp:Transcript_34013/g.33174  ORF Transcript_34013/g.33174 Transcript_34013/m.33174 type:complete len:143 (-) Transcript_34013:347-775(-)